MDDGESGVGEKEEVVMVDWVDRRIHGAGVTAILPLGIKGGEVVVVTGSYDDHIRLVNVPVGARRRVLCEMNLGGGVWRIKLLEAAWDSVSSSGDGAGHVVLLVSCMHAGARIVRLVREEEGGWGFEVLAKFEEHKSMNYGSDCQPARNDRGQWTFVTTSFYDRLLCLWRY